jgi:hypothetical protein
VAEAAKVAFAALEPKHIQCLGCDSGTATLTPQPADDPHGVQLVYPMFCTHACAVSWALDTARDEHHLCEPDGEWHAGRQEDCGVCKDYDAVGEPDPDPHPVGR